MSILVIGSTRDHRVPGSSPSAKRDVEVRALTRSPETARVSSGVTPVRGDPGDVDSLRAALDSVSTMFLLTPNIPDELTQAMLALTVAREAGVKGIVYLSVFKSEAYADVPHFASKLTVEHMIEALDLPATVLRSAYFIQNDLRQMDALLKLGTDGAAIGEKGISMVDIRDIGEAAAIELVRRERAPTSLGRETYALVGTEALTGDAIAAIWSEMLGRAIHYDGGDLGRMEQRLKAMLPAWHALDLRLMFSRYQSEGAIATTDDIARLSTLLGRSPRSYRDFAGDASALWARG